MPVGDGHRAIAEALLAAVDAAIEAGDSGEGWQMPWHGLDHRPSNPVTGAAYRGSNLAVLAAAAARRRHERHYWASRSSWRALGGTIRTAAEPVAILVPVFDEARRRDHVAGRDRPIGADASDRKEDLLLGFRRALVFNVADVVGANLPPSGQRTAIERVEAMERLVAAYRADRGPALAHGGVRAYYSPEKDRVVMPDREAFHGSDGEDAHIAYYAVLAHELIHSTGSPGRLARSTLARYFRSPAVRAHEELVAEIGAAIVGAETGIATAMRSDHVEYVKAWRAILDGDPATVMQAIADAELAARFVLEPDFRQSSRKARHGNPTARR